jgi:XapX domain-containing protein
MLAYLVSLVMGLAVGVTYGLVQVRSPAPPLIALIGLLGMVLGEQGVGTAKQHLMPVIQTFIQRAHPDSGAVIANADDRPMSPHR